MKGNFYISETEYISPTTLHDKGKSPPSQVIYSNVKELVEQQQYVFDSFWSRAIPIEQRIMEIEEGLLSPIKTKVLEDKENIFNYMKSVVENASESSVCSSVSGMQLAYNNFFDEYREMIDRNRRKGEGTKGVRWITTVYKDNIDLVKLFLNVGVQIRHIKNLTPMNFAVGNRYFYAYIDKVDGGKIMESLLVSNEPVYITHFNYIFESIWENTIDAEERIRDIEEGGDLSDIEVIRSSSKAQELYLNIVKSAAKEILLIFPTTNAFIRQEAIGILELAAEAARERSVKARILMPADKLTEENVQSLKQQKMNIDIRYIEQMSETKATIVVVDRKVSLVMEIREDSKTTFVEAIGLSTYSNSKAGVLSYVAIFENLWIQSELYEQLKVHDKMQKEFINIAAHELRTPIQPILALTGLLRSSRKRSTEEQDELLDVILRNARKLKRLTEDILDVTRIQSQSLYLKEEQFNLNDVITDTINDIKIDIVYLTKNEKENIINLLYQQPQDIIVRADKGRITQVIFNLLSNGVKFTNEGTISISLEKKEKDNGHFVVVSVKDTGQGIDPEIMPRLFTKFATNSITGTGLGLYISKSIVEAHGGKIWADNNNDGEKGATFYFTLPLSKQQYQKTTRSLERNSDSYGGNC
jgi:two-component system, OmpR family, sensor histidine kinase VicK